MHCDDVSERWRRRNDSAKRDDPTTTDLVFLVAIGLSFLLLLFGTFGLLSNGQFKRLDAGCPTRVSCDDRLFDTANRGKTYQVVANAATRGVS